MILSPDGSDYLKRREVKRLSRYLDQAGKPTIGYGHLIHPAEELLFQSPITDDEAEKLFQKDLLKYEDAVSHQVHVDLEQHQFDALVIFTFNVGIPAFEQSTLLRLVNLGKLDDASEWFAPWKYVTIDGKKVESKGLIRRRDDERRIFQYGEYSR